MGSAQINLVPTIRVDSLIGHCFIHLLKKNVGFKKYIKGLFGYNLFLLELKTENTITK